MFKFINTGEMKISWWKEQLITCRAENNVKKIDTLLGTHETQQEENDIKKLW